MRFDQYAVAELFLRIIAVSQDSSTVSEADKEEIWDRIRKIEDEESRRGLSNLMYEASLGNKNFLMDSSE